MAKFKHWTDYQTFRKSVIKDRRYIHSDETKHFLDTLADSSANRIFTEKSSAVLYRAQNGCDGNEPKSIFPGTSDKFRTAYSEDRMKPLKDKAKEGRANPKGIPYLYCANDVNVAIAEVRPWIGEFVSVAQLKLTQDIRLIDCISGSKIDIFSMASKKQEIDPEIFIWDEINTAFATPISPNDSTANYIPTQIVAELFRSLGVDGISYHSVFATKDKSLITGANLVLFNSDLAQIRLRQIYRVDKLILESTLINTEPVEVNK